MSLWVIEKSLSAFLRCSEGRDWHLTDKPPAPEFVAYWTNSGQKAALGLDLSAAIDPSATMAVRCGNGFDAGLPRYKRRGDCDLRTVPHHK